jgi:branched-chain amino acid transport system permease protein
VLIREGAGIVGPVVPFISNQLPAVQNAVFGLTIIVFLIVEPRGLDRIWHRIKDYVRFWPFRY